jgi:hypothetical protein
MLLDTDADAAGLEVDDSYLFNLDGEDKGQVSKRRRTGAAASGTSAIAAQTSKNPELAVDASRIGSVARFLNHCCEPNCYTRIIKAGGKQRIVLYSKERIEQGEEITYNYQFDYEDDRSNAIPCCCGARKCTGWLN